MRKSGIAIVVIVLAAILCAGASATAQQTDAAKTDVTPRMDYSMLVVALEQSGVSYQKVDHDKWIINVNFGETPGRILVTTNMDIISMNVLIAAAPKSMPQKLIEKFAQLNNKYYFIKFVYDENAIYLRLDMLLSAINGAVISNYINRMTMTANNEMAGILEVAGISVPPQDNNKGKK